MGPGCVAPAVIDVRLATTAEEREDALAVRRAVFIEEQGVPEDLEREADEDADHFVAYDEDEGENEAIGAARLRPVEDGAKVERVAVLSERRGEGIGEKLMDAIEATARFQNVGELVLHAQLPVAEFYDRLDYDRVGDTFEEAGIEHVKMVKTL